MLHNAIKSNSTAADDPELHSILVKYFEDYENNRKNERNIAYKNRDYVNHNQWTDAEKSVLRRRRQQPVVNNVIRKNLNYLLGYELKIRTDPEAKPRTPSAVKDSIAITDALRYVSDNTKFDSVRTEFWEQMLVEGIGAAEITISRNEKREILTNHIPYDRLFYDYYSRKSDFKDARFTGIVIWDDAESIKQKFPNAKNIIDFAIKEHADSMFSDKPSIWVDSSRNRARVIQIYFIYEGLWHLAFLTKAGYLSPPTLSPWLDENNQPRNGMIMKSAYMDREGNRFGEVTFQIETQDGINQRESKMAHLLSQRQTWGNSKAFPKGVNKAKSELAKPDGHVELKGDTRIGEDFGILQTNDLANGQFQLLQESKQAALSMSTDAFQGQPTDGMSGRAIIANQTGKQIGILPLAESKRQWEANIYATWWDMIRQFWTDERWIRVTDNNANTKFVGLNKKVTVREVLTESNIEVPQELQNDPRLNAVSRIDNQVSEIDVDIVITDSPDIATLESQEFEKLIALANVGITFDKQTYIKASNLRNKEELLKGIEGENEQQQEQLRLQQEDIQQQAITNAELQNAAVMAEVEKDGADTGLKRADTAKKEQEAMQIAIENDQLARGIKL